MKKKFLLSFILMCVSIFAFGMLIVSAETTGTYGDLTYEIENGEITITDCDESATEIEIPEEIDGKPVTAIDNYAFYNCNELTQINWNAKNVSDFTSSSDIFYGAGTQGDGIDIVFGDSVEHIPAYLFYVSNLSYQPKIKSVTIGDSVTAIGNYAFYNCSGLTSVTIGDSVTAIGNYAFRYCSELINMFISDGVTTIGAGAFRSCVNLLNITLGENVETIGNEAFCGCRSIQKLNWNAKSVADFDSDSEVFVDAGLNMTVIFGDNVEHVPAWAFSSYEYGFNGGYDTANVSKIVTGKSLKSIGMRAFDHCSSLKSIELNDGIEQIGGAAFMYCDNLKSITIPQTVTTIDNGAFRYCYALEEIVWNVKSMDDSLFGTYVFADCGTDENGISVIFGDNVEYIPAYLFYASEYTTNSSVTSLTIAESVTSIGSYAFYQCTGLNSITIPDSVASIGNYAFYNCTGLTNIAIPFIGNESGDNKDDWYGRGLSRVFGNSIEDTLTKLTLTNETAIPEYAFKDYENLTDITLNDGITSIGESAFSNCGYANNEDNWDGEYLYLGNYLIGAKPTVVAASVKDGTTVMIDNIFKDCIDLLKVTLPESLVNISNGAFSGCTDLFSITLPSKINAIGKSAFYNCNKITKINIPSTVTKIGDSAFYGCNKLAGVYITDIGEWCNIEFGNSSSNPLNYAGKLYVNDVLAEEVIVPQSITQLNDYVFYNCDNMKNIKLSDNLTSIGDYAFSYCDNLQSISIPSKVTNIGESAFSNCRALNTVSIPKSVTGIGDNAFSSCWNVDNVYIEDLSVWCKLDFEENESNPLRYGANLYLNNTLVKELSIPSDITTINKNQFYNCGSITAVKIHSKVEKIEENAFYGCENIEYVEIPKDLFYIRNNAFYGCDSLAEVHYGGTESEWEEIIIADGNDSLKNARVQSIYYITLIDDDGNTSSITCLPNEKIKLSDIEKKYMHKVTLYDDEKMTKEFDTEVAINDNMTLYVKLGEEITVIYGDIDDDGEITMNDAIYLFNAAMFPDQYSIPSGQKTDYNGDGKFDMNDAIYLFNHAMFPEQYPI